MFSVLVGEAHELIWKSWGSSHLRGTLQAMHQEVEDQAVVLEDETGKLKASYKAVGVGVRHIFVLDCDVVF